MDDVNMMGHVSGDLPFQEFTRYFDFMRHWGDLHQKFVQHASPQYAQLPAQRRREFLVNAVAEDDLLVSMSSDLGLFREVIKRLKSRPWFAEDLESLASEVLADMMFPGSRYDDRERERLIGSYPEVFLKLEDIKFGAATNSPIHFRDVESKVAELDDLETALTCVRWSAVSKDVDTEEGYTALMQELVDHGSRLRGVDPIALESLSDFQDLMDKKSSEVTAKCGMPAEQRSWLFFAIQDRVMVPETLHFFLMQAMGLRMFRELDRSGRHDLMGQEYKLQLGPAYASRSVLLLGDYHRDRVQAPEKVLKAIEAYVRDGRQQFALELCLKSIRNLPLDEQYLDQLELTSGILYLANDMPHKAADVFQRSLGSARRREDHAREAIVCAYLGASYALLRRNREAHTMFEESLSIGTKRKGDPSDVLEDMLLMADLAHESNEHGLEKSFLERAMSMADGTAEEAKIKPQISMMIEAADAHVSGSQQP
jgi:hypothetical protein